MAITSISLSHDITHPFLSTLKYPVIHRVQTAVMLVAADECLVVAEQRSQKTMASPISAHLTHYFKELKATAVKL